MTIQYGKAARQAKGLVTNDVEQGIMKFIKTCFCVVTVMIMWKPGMSRIINEDGEAVTKGGARAVLTEWS